MAEADICICFRSYSHPVPLIQCCHCKRWYHCKCVHATDSDMEDPKHYYCMMCIENKPPSEDEEEYNFDEDQRRQRELNQQTRKRVRLMLQDDKFNSRSVLSMDRVDIVHTICCIEQQLLLEDHSPSIHDTVSSYPSIMYSPTEENKLVQQKTLYTSQLQKSLFHDVKKYNMYNRVFQLSAYYSIQGNHKNSNRFVKEYDEYWMKLSRYLLDFEIPGKCIGINADVRTFNWTSLGMTQQKLTGRLFDVIVMDPPWHLSTSDPSRGVAIQYQQLEDEEIASIPLHAIQNDGLLFIWVINSKITTALRMLQRWGYSLVGDIAWIKLSSREHFYEKLISSHGFYLQHAKETCLVAMKGLCTYVDKTKLDSVSDVIFSTRRGQSQKPDEIYDIIERLVPNGYYIEIFGRRNNLRDDWVTIGDEI